MPPKSHATKDEFFLMGKQLLNRVMIKLAQVLIFQLHCGFLNPFRLPSGLSL